MTLLGTVVGAQTYVEYETWQDQEWGVLEHVFAVTTAGLEPVPAWRCVDPPEPLTHGAVTVTTFWDLESTPDTQTDWVGEVSARLPVDFRFSPMIATDGLDEAWQHAQSHPTEIVLVYTDQYYRGPILNDRLEGFACGNVAVINTNIECPESIVAHEIGHVLGLRHTASGLMRARGVACDDTLLDQQSLWLKQRYPGAGDGFIPNWDAESAESGTNGNGNAEPEPRSDVL